MKKVRPESRPHDGFTLVELLIVIVILGILAAIVVPKATNASREASQSAFIASVRTYAGAASLYHAKTGDHLPDGSSGLVPPGFEPYINVSDWTAVTPIGGVWDTEMDDSGVKSALGVHFDGSGDTQDDAFMLEVDTTFDNGDLGTGSFQKLGDGRFYYVLQK